VILINLSDEEKHLLKGYFTTSPIALIRLKAQTVLMRNKRMKLEDIAELVFRDIRTIERWTKDFSQRRMASIFSGLAENENASKLTRVQKEGIRGVLQKPPSEQGLPKDFWDIPTLKEYVRAEFGVVYESIQSYHFLLKFNKLSFKYPDRFNIRRDEEAIRKRMIEIREEIAPYLSDPSWEVFSSDETRLQLEAITRRAWLKKGEKTVIKVERSREFQNYLGFLNQKTFQNEVYPIAWGRQEEIIKAITIHIRKYPNKRICVVWDNAKCHKGKLLRKELRKNGLLSRVHLINLPPYAPDMDPIEHVWRWGKDAISNTQFETFNKTKEAFIASVTSRTFHYEI
jgi:transposase